MKTNAARLLDKLGISYQILSYEVDPDDLAAESTAQKVGLPPEQVFKTLVVRGDTRQFLALLGGTMAHTHSKLAATAAEHGGLIWAIDALQPEGHGTLLYVLYEVLSGTPVSAIQLPQAQGQQLIEWLQPYQKLTYKVLATLSDGESAIIAAMN